MDEVSQPKPKTRWWLAIVIGLSPVAAVALLLLAFLVWLLVTGGAHGFR